MKEIIGLFFWCWSPTNNNQRQKNNPIISFIILVSPKFLWVFQTGFLLPIVRTKYIFFYFQVAVIFFFFFCLKNSILFLKLFWPTVRKNVLVIEKNFWEFKAEGREFAKFIRTVKGQINYGHIIFSQLIPGGFYISYIRTIMMPIGTHNWDVQAYRNNLEKLNYNLKN
jgi:hypothetical protein